MGVSGPGPSLNWVEVDLPQIERNVRELVRFLQGTPLLVVVKADGYGHGMLPVARRALAGGARFLGVTSVEEGRALRRAGILAPVLLLQPLPAGEAQAALGEQLRVTVTNREEAEAVSRAAQATGRSAVVHLKLDTGMGRFGTTPREGIALLRYLLGLPGIHVEGIYSHLSCADEPGHPETERQIREFQSFVAAVEEAAPDRQFLFHLANTGGLLYYPQARFGLCRTGLGAYGIYPCPAPSQEAGKPGEPALPAGAPRLAPALSLHARVVSVRRVPAGFPVGYGCTYRTSRRTQIAVVSAGYANGVPRGLSNRGRVLIGGRSYPIVGRVCMNQVMVDVGLTAPVRVGDEAVLLGRDGEEAITVEEWCRLLDTIPHEVLCRVGSSAPRLYRPEA